MVRPFSPALLTAAFAIVAIVSLPCSATEIYRWVDDKGVVNYSSSPPATGKVRILDPLTTTVSVYTPPRNETARAGELLLRAKVERLERELHSARLARLESAQQENDRRRLEYERCLRDRRVDCDEARGDPYYSSPGYVVAVVRPRVFPAQRIVPTLPVPRPRTLDRIPTGFAPAHRTEGPSPTWGRTGARFSAAASKNP